VSILPPDLQRPLVPGLLGPAVQYGSLRPTPTLFREVELRDLALDRIRQGLCVFDEQQRLLLFNRLYAEMYGLDPGQLWIGMTLRDVVDLRYAAGTGPGMPPEEYALWRDRIGMADQIVKALIGFRGGDWFVMQPGLRSGH